MKDIEKFNHLLKTFNKVKMISMESEKENELEKYEYLVECNGKKLRKVIELLNKLKWIVGYRVE